MKKYYTKHFLFSFLVFLSFSFPSFAAHIIGNDITVQRLSANNYQVTVNFFRDCAGAGANFPGLGGEPAMYIGVYDKVTNIQQQVITMGAPTITLLPEGDACYPSSVCVQQGVYVGTATIPNNPNGYYFSWLRCCRNVGIVNVSSPNTQGSVFYAEIPDPAIVNSTPTFNTVPQATQGYMCATYTNYVDFSATDTDGDVLVYSLETPLTYSGAINPNQFPTDINPAPYSTIPWQLGYSATDPFGPSSTTLGSSTGLLTVTPPNLGIYVLTVKVEEWRGGIKIGEIRRDFQFEVLTCQRLNISVAPLTTVCVGQVATLTATGALPGWTYSWAPGGETGPNITGMSMVNGITTYTCVAYASPPGGPCIMNTGGFVTNSPTAAVATTGNVCLGQNTTLTASGAGTAGTYTWMPGGSTNAALTGVANGTYTVVATNANGCTDDATGTVYQAPVITATVAVTNTNCSGTTGTATVTASPGSPPYTYAWTGSGQVTSTATGLANGNHSVTVTDSKGCSVVKAFTVSVTSSPTVTISPTTAGCTVSNGTATANVSGGGTPYTYVWGNGQSVQTATGLSAGSNYSVLVTSANGCTGTKTVTISSTNPPTIATTSSTIAGCSVANGTATANPSGGTGGYTYTWMPGGQNSQTATGLAGGDYTVTIADANNCTVATTVSVNTTPVPTLTANATQATCGNNNGTATASVSGGTPGYSYLWSGSGQTTSTATGLSVGNYNITVTDGNGCTQTNTVNVTNAGAPLISSITSSSFGCASTFGVATVSAYNGTPGYTYNWAPGGQSAPTATGLTAGDYTVTITDANGCSVVTTISVTVTSPPAITASTNQATCGNNNGTATANPTGGTPGYTYLWSNGETTSTISNLAPGNYSVTVSDNSCNISGNELVTNGDFSAGDVGFSSTYTVCVPNCQEGSYAVGTDPNAVHAAWTSCGDHTSGAGNFMIVNGAGTPGADVWCQTVAVTPNTNYTFSAWVVSQYPVSPSQLQFSINGTPLCSVFTAPATLCTWQQFFCTWNSGSNTTANICILNQNTTLGGNDFGLDDISFQSCTPCVVTTTVAVTQPAILATSVSQTDLLCNGNNIGTATVSPSAGTPSFTYSWSSGQTTSAITGLAAGNYAVTVTDANGCSSTNTVTITQPPSITSAAAQTAVLCNGGSTGSASVTTGGGTPAYTYNWSNGQTTSAISGLVAGNYTMTITDANGCTSTNSITITEPTALASSTAQSAILCNGGTATVSVSSGGGTPAYSYSWSNGQSTSAIAGISAGNYSVVVTDANGCSTTNTLSITQPTTLMLTSTCNDSICAGDSTLLSMTASGGTPNYTYTWLPGPQVGPSISVSPTSSTIYQVTATDANGCVSAVQTCNVAILPVPNAIFDTLSTGMFGATFGFYDQSTGGLSWFWTFGDGTSSTDQNPIHTFPGAGTYTVTQIVYNQFGCPDTFKIVVDYEDGILIPNVFTPDGDGVNDVWYIPNSGLREFHVEIYDRWGLKVFETTADEIRWDGYSTAGKLLSDGTYYYVLKAVLASFNGDKDYSTKGYVTLLTQKRK